MRLKKALFLDRDGVVNVEKHYVHKIEDFEFIEGVFELAMAAQAKGYLIIVITNQSGIGRGFYSEAIFHQLTKWMVEQFRANGVTIAKVYFAPHHPEHGIGRYKSESEDRKPNPGMILKAAKEFQLDLTCSVLVGDQSSDVQAGRTAGVGHIVLYAPGMDTCECQPPPDCVVKRLTDTVPYL